MLDCEFVLEFGGCTSVLEEYVLEGLSIHSAAASAALELTGNLFGISCWTADFDDVRRGTVVLECNVVGVRKVRGAEGRVHVSKDIVDFPSCLGAVVIGSQGLCPMYER